MTGIALNIQLLAVGISIGFVYALIALAFLVIYNGVGGLNFAQGDFVTIGAFTGIATTALGASPWLGVAVSCLILSGLGLALHRFVFMPIHNRPGEVFIIATIGVSIALSNAAQIIWGPAPLSMPSLAGDRTFTGFGIVLPFDYLIIVILGCATLLLFYGFFMHTFYGRQLRAIATDRPTSALIGINVNSMSSWVFVLSGITSAIAGCVIAPLFFATPTMGLPLGIKAFVAIVIGGFGNMVGAVIGGLIVGILESYIGYFVSTDYTEAIIFGILIAVLLVAPSGLFGERIEEKV